MSFSLFLIHFHFGRYSFIDLAQIICKVPELKVENSDESSSESEYEGYISEPSNLNQSSKIHVERTGGSLSLSENDFDSDELEIPLSLTIPKSSKSSDSSPSKNSNKETIKS